MANVFVSLEMLDPSSPLMDSVDGYFTRAKKAWLLGRVVSLEYLESDCNASNFRGHRSNLLK